MAAERYTIIADEKCRALQYDIPCGGGECKQRRIGLSCERGIVGVSASDL
jgi:hypothetical protein